MKKIAVFSHKGGVSKTTTIFHIGWKLAELGKKVLFVDADSQCNLTLTVLGDDNYEKFYRENPKRNIKNALSAAFMALPELIKPVECIQVKDSQNLFLLPGSFEITEYEVQLGVSFQITNTFTTMKNLPGSFNYLIEKTAEKYDAEFVLIDMNPSLSAINQDLILSSDYFIIPTAPDFFSNMALKSLTRILPNWERWAKDARILFEDATYPLPQKSPKFIGYTVNDFSIRHNEPAKAFKNIIENIKETVDQLLIPGLRRAGLLLSEDIYEDYCITKIPNFATLQAKSQKYGVPVFALTDEQLETVGDVLSNQKEMRERFNVLYTDFANKIIKLTADA
jgi:cellulose biosynthesis protein BcsQ